MPRPLTVAHVITIDKVAVQVTYLLNLISYIYIERERNQNEMLFVNLMYLLSIFTDLQLDRILVNNTNEECDKKCTQLIKC
jgi:hypothetical protein